MALTRKDRLIAFLPPVTSDGSGSSDDENIPVKSLDVIENSDSDKSEAPSILYEAAAAMENIMDNLSDTDDASEAGVIPKKQNTPVKKYSPYTDYWSQKFRYNDIAEVMPLKRYQQIRRYIHFVNNANQNDDPYFKIRPALEIVRKNCIAVEEKKKQSIDEMMVPYKGKKVGSKRQYIKSKPNRWGFKIFVRAGVSGIVYDFVVYGGEKTFKEYHQFTCEDDSLGLGAKVVILSLCKSNKNKERNCFYAFHQS
nr:unnamed protein product [Callosobruchus chinensis]